MSSSPTMAGWRTVSRQPALVLGEIAWRWIFGLIALLVLVFALVVYLGTVPVPESALWLIATHQPALVSIGLIYTLRGTGLLSTKIILVALPPLAVLWIFMAALGRAATLQPMLRPAMDVSSRQALWPRLLGISFLRFSLWFATGISFAGAAIAAFAGSAGSADDVRVSRLMFVVLAGAIVTLSALPAWLLSLAAIFVVRDRTDIFESISSALDLLHQRAPELLATTSLWGALRGAGFIAATLVGVGIFIPAEHVGFVFAGLLVTALLYFAFSDLVYIGRLASYVSIIEAALEPSPAPPLEPQPSLDFPPLSELSSY